MTPYAQTQTAKKKKRAGGADDAILEENAEGDDVTTKSDDDNNASDDDVSNDAMIKVNEEKGTNIGSHKSEFFIVISHGLHVRRGLCDHFFVLLFSYMYEYLFSSLTF